MSDRPLESMVSSDVSKRLTKRRLQLGVRQHDVAVEAGLSVTTVARVERGIGTRASAELIDAALRRIKVAREEGRDPYHQRPPDQEGAKIVSHSMLSASLSLTGEQDRVLSGMLEASPLLKVHRDRVIG